MSGRLPVWTSYGISSLWGESVTVDGCEPWLAIGPILGFAEVDLELNIAGAENGVKI